MQQQLNCLTTGRHHPQIKLPSDMTTTCGVILQAYYKIMLMKVPLPYDSNIHGSASSAQRQENLR
jgi:hypothetical protein